MSTLDSKLSQTLASLGISSAEGLQSLFAETVRDSTLKPPAQPTRHPSKRFATRGSAASPV